jgi:hypothetical protein
MESFTALNVKGDGIDGRSVQESQYTGVQNPLDR